MCRKLGAVWRRRLCWFVVACVCSVLFPDRATAGQASAAGSIIGQVKDGSGAVLPGVTVTAKSPALQVGSVVGVTDEQGEYRLTPLPIGVYTVDYELQGFQTLRQEDVRITTGFVARLDVHLSIGAVAETVTVSGAAPVVDVTSTTTTTRFNKETLEVLPTNRNGLNSLLVQAPGTRGTMEAGGKISFSPPTIRTFGQGGEPWYVLEGIYTPSPDSGGGLGNYWDYNSIEEASVQTLGTNAEVGGRGAFVSGVVKSGGNDFHGGSTWSYMSKNLQWNNIDSGLAAQGISVGDTVQGRYDLSGDLGGRIIRDKLWFYGAVRDRQNYFDALGATPPPGKRNFQNQRGNWTAKGSYQMTQNNKLIGYVTQNRRSQESIDQFTPWGSRVDSPLWPTIYKIEWQAIRGSSLVTSVQLGRWGYVSPARNTPERGDFDQGPSIFDQFTRKVSGANASVGRAWDVHRYNPKAVVTWYKPNWFMGNHEIKGGFDLFYDYDTQPRSARQANYRLTFNNGAPLQIDTYSGPINPLEKQVDYGLYAQDSWTIQRRLTLNLGLRYNHENAYIPSSCRVAATTPADVLFPAQCFDKIQFNLLNQLMPRVRVAFDLTGDSRTVLKGGWGRYYYRRVIEADVSYADPNNLTTATYRWRDLNSNRDYDVGEVNWNANGPDFISLVGGVNTIVNPDETVPKDDEFSATLERQLGTTMSIRATTVYTRRRDVYRTTNLLRPPSAYSSVVRTPDPGPDGIVSTGDDPGTSITFYEYPASMSGRAFERFMRINDPAATPTYKSFDVGFNRRLANHWAVSGSYSATKTDAPFGGTASVTSIAGANDPNSEIFQSNHTWEWLGHLTGSYLLPADVTLSAVYEHRSGTPYARQVNVRGAVVGVLTLNVEPIGTRRLPDTRSLDLRAEKSFTIYKQQKAKLRLNLYNVLNSSTVTTVTTTSGSAFDRPTAIMGPRVAELGFVYVF